MSGRFRGLLLVCSSAICLLAIPATAQAANKWAVVTSAGALVRSNGATAAAPVGTGTYQVTFKTDMTNCAFIADPGDPGAGAVGGPAIATVAERAGNTKALFIQTFDQTTGALTNEPFHVTTYCGTGLKWAVVGSDGSLARGGHVTSTTHLSAGNYEVAFDTNVHKCAFTATVGTTSTGSVATPGEITVAGRAGNKMAVFVHTEDRSGVAADSSFHLGVTCGTTRLYAVVDTTSTTATLARGSKVTSVAKLGGAGTGTYQVIFNRAVSTCAYEATVGVSANGGSVTDPVAITTATRAGNANGVFLFVHQTNGATIDEPFHLTVYC
jgi:hypothetical protein